MGVITTQMIYSARRQGEITQGVSVNRRSKVRILGTLDMREERGPARETEKEPAVELGGKKKKRRNCGSPNKLYRGKKVCNC